MGAPTYKLDEAMRIVYINESFFAAWLSWDQPPLQLTTTDFIILDAVAHPELSNKLSSHIVERTRDLIGLQLTPKDIRMRIQELCSKRVLTKDRGNQAPLRSIVCQDIDTLPAPEDFDAHSSQKVRFSKNTMFQPSSCGLGTWCARPRKFQYISIDLFILLLKIVDPIKFGIPSKYPNCEIQSVRRATQWAMGQGLLVAERKQTDVPNSTAKSISSVGHQHQHLTSEIIEGALSRITEPTWQKVELNGRIPVYFVPHNANHYPLALGMIYSFLKEYKNGKLLDHFALIPITYFDPNSLLAGPYKRYGTGVWLFSSYMWSSELNLAISGVIKKQDPENIIIHGGPGTPDYEAACASFMRDNSFVDISVHGEGEIALAEILDNLSSKGRKNDVLLLEDVDGITYRNSATGTIHRTGSRIRMRDLDILPSPYLTGAFDNYGTAVVSAIIESNRGCPFGCTFCDWGSATNQKVRKFDLQRVKDEIEWIGRNKVRVIWVADANFGIYERDIELANWICEVKQRYGFPREVVVNYTKNATEKLATIVEAFSKFGICSQGVISIQTRDQETLRVINRKNISTDKYGELAEIFKAQNLPLSTDLMIGLPGSTPQSFMSDLQYYFDKDISVKAYPTQLLPNSPMADPDYMARFAIQVDANNYLTSTFSYTEQDLLFMKNFYAVFYVAESYSLLRYLLRYLQWEKGIPAMQCLSAIYDCVARTPRKHPAITFAFQQFRVVKAVPGGWKNFYDQIAEFLLNAYDIPLDSALATVLRYNEAVMPDDAVMYPQKVFLEHDFLMYWKSRLGNPSLDTIPLETYAHAEICIDDIYGYTSIDFTSAQYDDHQIFWELPNESARSHSVPSLFQQTTEGPLAGLR